MLTSIRTMAPRLVYDGDCGFCRYTVDYARAVTGDAVEYMPYQSVVDQYPEYSAEDFARSIRLFASGTHGLRGGRGSPHTRARRQRQVALAVPAGTGIRDSR